MSVTKKINTGNYSITTSAAQANVVVTTDTFKIYGNLFVQGNSSVINVSNISTADPTITLNSNVASPYQGYSGIDVYRGPNDSIPALYWNETTGSWQITTNIANPTLYSNISTESMGTGSVGAGTATHLPYYATSTDTVVDGGANLTWDGTSILTVTGNVVTTNLKVNNTSITPTTANAGGTGINFNNGTQNGELISKRKALAFSIIFG